MKFVISFLMTDDFNYHTKLNLQVSVIHLLSVLDPATGDSGVPLSTSQHKQQTTMELSNTSQMTMSISFLLLDEESVCSLHGRVQPLDENHWVIQTFWHRAHPSVTHS